MTLVRRVAGPGLLTVLALGGLGGLVGCGDDTLATRYVVTVRHSSYAPASLTVPAGRPVTLLIRNDDPIDHEWIVGDDTTHARHRTGTEPTHQAVPSEVSLPALGEKTTTITFASPGDYRVVCHLPGHEDYGMTGTIRVV